MEGLSEEQINLLSKDIEQEGIRFEPLRSELIDHLICDVESKMEEGHDFEIAWKSVKAQIPQNHFKNIQKETMDILSGKFKVVTLFTRLAIGLLALGTVFKILHLEGANMLLLSFLIVSCLVLLIGSGRSVSVYRESRGRLTIWLATCLIVTFITGLSFRLLHLPGASMLLYLSTIGLSILLPILSFYFYFSKDKLKNHLLIRLIEDNQKSVKHIALTLIGFGILMNYGHVLLGGSNFGGTIFFIFSIILIGLSTYSYTWIHYVNSFRSANTINTLLLIFSSLALIMFMLPMFVSFLFPTEQGIGFVVRQFSAFGALVVFDVIVCIHYAKYSSSENKRLLAPLSTALIFYPFLRLGIKLEWFEGFLGGLMTNNAFIISFLLFLIVLLIRFRKEQLFSALIILTLASHMIPTM